MFQITRKLSDFSAAHRLIHDYQGKCRHLHGHNYEVTVTVARAELCNHGFVLDFAAVKQHCDAWIQAHWDHVTLLVPEDKSLLQFLQDENMRYFLLSGYRNTTSENLAHYLYQRFNTSLQQLSPDIRLVAVEVFETAMSCARFGV